MATSSWSCAIWGALGLAACGEHRAGPVGSSGSAPRYVGEVHLHQDALESHSYAQFYRDSILPGTIPDDGITSVSQDPTRTEGACALYVVPNCSPACDVSSVCTGPNVCRALFSEPLRDGGQVTVSGSSTVAALRMSWDTTRADYASVPPPGPIRLFAGGETLQVNGALPFAATLRAPKIPALIQPDPASVLHVPRAGLLAVHWQPEGAQGVRIHLFGDAPVGASAFVRCQVPDNGAYAVPGDLLAGLPPPPRQVRLVVDRYDEHSVPAPDGTTFVFIQAVATASVLGSD